MPLTAYHNPMYWNKRFFFKSLVRIKFAILLLLCFSLQTLANKDTQKVTLFKKEVTLDKVFRLNPLVGFKMPDNFSLMSSNPKDFNLTVSHYLWRC